MKRTNTKGWILLVVKVLVLALVWTLATVIGRNEGKATARETIAAQDKVNVKQAEDIASLQLQIECLKNTNDELGKELIAREKLISWAGAYIVRKRGKK
jgi:hypothetical protein